MNWPNFDLAEAINQAVSALATVLGVLLGGWLAFRLGVRQLRSERALDRRLEWQEKLHSAAFEYLSMLRVLIGEYEKAPNADENAQRFRSHVLTETTRLGRVLQESIRRTDLYGTAEEREHSARLFKLQLDTYIASWTASTSAAAAVDSGVVASLKELQDSLEAERRHLARRIRLELNLADLPEPQT